MDRGCLGKETIGTHTTSSTCTHVMYTCHKQRESHYLSLHRSAPHIHPYTDMYSGRDYLHWLYTCHYFHMTPSGTYLYVGNWQHNISDGGSKKVSHILYSYLRSTLSNKDTVLIRCSSLQSYLEWEIHAKSENTSLHCITPYCSLQKVHIQYSQSEDSGIPPDIISLQS